MSEGTQPESRQRGGIDNLIPCAPGEIRNPKGINQYTYRQTFEDQIARILAEELGDDSPVTNSEAIGRKAVELALDGDKIALKAVLERVWVAVKEVNIGGQAGNPLTVAPPDLSHMTPEELAEGKRIAAKMLMGRPAQVEGGDE